MILCCIRLDHIGLNLFKLNQLELKHDLKKALDKHGIDKHGFDKHGQEKMVKF